MGIEIEKKYLVDLSKLPDLTEGTRIKQGYISTSIHSVVRIRYTDDASYVTIKGATEGISRLEFEYLIPNKDADEMLKELCSSPVIDKTRYKVKHSKHTWEVDRFHGLNDGLVIAEVELNDESEAVDLPDWVTSEVSGDGKYSNSNLYTRPFSSW